jgi:hypothetical protein
MERQHQARKTVLIVMLDGLILPLLAKRHAALAVFSAQFVVSNNPVLEKPKPY